MKTATTLLEPEPHRQRRFGDPARLLNAYKLPDFLGKRPLAARVDASMPYLLAPSPWPRGEFRTHDRD